MRNGDAPIVIVGGGIGGMAAACALAHKDYRSILVEQASSFSEIGAGVQFGPNAIRMLRRIGFTDELKNLAIYPDYALMLDSVTGKEVTRIPYGPPFGARFGEPYALVHRADLHQKLREAALKTGRVEMRAQARIVSVAQNGDTVTATAEDGQRYTGAALIGADGLWSTIRQCVVGDGKPRVSGHITYRAVLPAAEMPEHLRKNVMTLWAGDKVHAVHYPLRGGELYNLAATFHSDRYEAGWDHFGEPEELHERFSAKHPVLRNLLEKIETWRMWVLCDREPVRNWSQGRITLLGDAAHPTLQYLGQGAAMALEDAIVLASELEQAKGDFAAAALAYQDKRYLRTARVQLMSRLYGEVYHATDVAREVRNSVLSAAPPSYESMAWMYDYKP